MDIKIIENRLKQYNIHSKQDELNAVKEIMQEIALAALARTNFFRQAAFQGGTCLRILYGLSRFSEDLDFIVLNTVHPFEWKPFLEKMQFEFETYGLHLEIQDRSTVDNAVKKAFIKEDSFGKLLTLMYPRSVSDIQKIQIKLEIDTNPPLGSQVEVKYVDFPYPFSVTVQEPATLFAGKCHAMLCREYVKGRDWFDFIWYVSQKTPINYLFLKNGLVQSGVWKNEMLSVTKDWVIEALNTKIKSIDWDGAKQDVMRFLRPRELESLMLWGVPFFLQAVEKLAAYLSDEA